MPALIASLLLTAATLEPRPSPPSPADAPAAIISVVHEMQAAWNRGDLKGYMQGFWNPGVRFVSGGRMLTGWQPTLDHYLRDYATAERRGRLCFYDLEVQMLAPDAAQLVGRYHLERAEHPQDGVNTRLFRNIGGRWVVVLNHVSNRQESGAAVVEDWRAHCDS